MSIEWRERRESRRMPSTASEPSIELAYTLIGVIDDVQAWSYALSATSPVWITAGQVLYRQDVRLDHRGNGIWHVDVPYGPVNKQTGQWDFDFDTQGGTVRIFQSKSTSRFPAGATDHKGAIDLQNGEIRGTEIVIPALRMNYSFRFPSGVVSEGYARNLARNTGKTNIAQWHGFDAGEALFLGGTGKSGSQSESTVQFSIACSENATGLTIGGIANVAKKGWETVWIAYEDDENNDDPIRSPKAVYAEKVYDEMDFASVLGF